VLTRKPAKVKPVKIRSCPNFDKLLKTTAVKVNYIKGYRIKMKFKRKERGSKLKYWFFGLVGIAAAASLIWVMVTKMEGEAPVVTMDLESGFIPASIEIPLIASDKKSGIRKVFASLVQDGREVVLANRIYDENSPEATNDFQSVMLTMEINAREKGLKEGPALLRIAAWDRSWRQGFSGNLGYLEKEIIIDSTPPRISVLSRQHNVARGGSGLVIYRLSEPCEVHGVRVGDNFFHGYSGHFNDDNVYLAFFALSHEQGPGTGLSLFAQDKAGNVGQSGFEYHIQNRVFASENLNISENFLRQVLPEFQSVPGMPVGGSRLEQFMFVNKTLRVQNNERLLSIHETSDATIYWEDGFIALPRAQRRAGFADHRTYMHNGEVIDREVHLGVDLASLRHAPVPAANNGRVAFVDWEGIYGNTVVVDHGFGLLSLYSHLSGTEVSVGDFVSKGDIVGNTGTTGLAGGDHLHFSIMVGNVFVNPYEWWDAAWIKNNITGKLDDVAAQVK
jgi:murein DD-endopeptidase MepM/ murein hydrolase activator NlpD